MCDGGNASCLAATGHLDGARVRIYCARVRAHRSLPPAHHDAAERLALATDAPLEGEKTHLASTRPTAAAGSRGSASSSTAHRLSASPPIRQPRAAADRSAPRPCPLGDGDTLAFDTATLPNGPHAVQASVTDAAGNETRSDPVTVTTLNGSQPNGRGASRFVKLSAWLRSRRDAAAALRRGAVWLGPLRRGAADRRERARRSPARCSMSRAACSGPARRYEGTGTVTTSEDGRFATGSRRARAGRSGSSTRPTRSTPRRSRRAAVSLGVRAGLRLKLKPRKVRNGQRIRFRGRLKGGPAARARA